MPGLDLAVDAARLASRICAEIGDEAIDNHVHPRLWHDFHLQASLLAEAERALTSRGARLRAPRRRASVGPGQRALELPARESPLTIGGRRPAEQLQERQAADGAERVAQAQVEVRQ